MGVLRLNRPKCLNAINRVMRDELTAFWRDHTRDAGLRVVLLCGAGRGFCAGLDTTDRELTGPSTTGSPDTLYAAQRSFPR